MSGFRSDWVRTVGRIMTAVAKVPNRGRGRPKVSDWRKYDFHRDYYVQVGTVRHDTLGITGKLRPAAEACRLLARRGGREVLSLDWDRKGRVTLVWTASQEAWPGAESGGNAPPGESRGGTPRG